MAARGRRGVDPIRPAGLGLPDRRGCPCPGRAPVRQLPWTKCRDVVTHLSAATKALEQAGFKLIAAGLTYCLENPDDAASDGYPLEAVERTFMKLA